MSDRVLTFNGKSHDVTVIDAGKRVPVATIALDGKPEFAVNDDKGRVFVNNEDKGEIVARSEASEDRQHLEPGRVRGANRPALDKAHRCLFSVCQNDVMVVLDADTGRSIARLPIGAGPDGVVFDASRGLAYSANGQDGTLTVVHEDDPTHFAWWQRCRRRRVHARSRSTTPVTASISPRHRLARCPPMQRHTRARRCWPTACGADAGADALTRSTGSGSVFPSRRNDPTRDANL